MYSNTSKLQVINIIENNSEIIKTVCSLTNNIYKHTEGLAMGVPISTVLAEAYIQYMEQLCPFLMKYQIIGYFRYVDDISIIYNHKKTNIDETSS
jgi:hypothetical protein